MADRVCPWCDLGHKGNVRSAAEKGMLLAALPWHSHEQGCVVNAIVRVQGSAEHAERWFRNVERYVQSYVARESFDA